VEVALLREVGRAPGRRLEGAARRRAIADHLQQMPTDGVEAVVVGKPSIGLELVDEGEPRRRAAGHGHRDGVVQRHHGVVGDPKQQFVQPSICGQSVASALGASPWIAAIAAWSW